MSRLKKEVANYENEVFDIQGKLDKLGRVTEDTASGEQPTQKTLAMREIDEKMNIHEDEKARLEAEVATIEHEMNETMQAIKLIGLTTLKLETELENSWSLVQKTQSEVESIESKREVTKDNVKAFMSSIEMKVAELLLQTGN